MRDVNNGWLIRYTHANVASFFFIFVYAHIYKFIINNNLFFIIDSFTTELNIEKPLYLKGNITGQKLASSKLLGLLYRWYCSNERTAKAERVITKLLNYVN